MKGGARSFAQNTDIQAPNIREKSNTNSRRERTRSPLFRKPKTARFQSADQGAAFLNDSIISARLRNPAVRAVAKWFRFRLFTGAPGDCFLFRDFRLQRPEAGAFMRAVAKWLGLGPPAGAPPVCPGFHRLDDGGFLKNDWVFHGMFVNPVCPYRKGILFTDGKNLEEETLSAPEANRI